MMTAPLVPRVLQPGVLSRRVWNDRFGDYVAAIVEFLKTRNALPGAATTGHQIVWDFEDIEERLMQVAYETSSTRFRGGGGGGDT